MKFINKTNIILSILFCIILIVSYIGIAKLDVDKNIDVDKYYQVPKDEIIDAFNENSKKFNSIIEYAQNGEGNLYVDNNSGTLIFSDGNNEKEIENIPVKDNLKFIINNLNYAAILEDEESILFVRVSGDNEQGIIYQKDGTKPTIQFDELELINNKCFYYKFIH